MPALSFKKSSADYPPPIAAGTLFRVRSLGVIALLALLVSATPVEAAFDIGMTVDGSKIVDVGQFRGVTVSYSWANLTEESSNWKIVAVLPSFLDTNGVTNARGTYAITA